MHVTWPECLLHWVLGKVLAPVQNSVSSVSTFHEKVLWCCALRDALLTTMIFPWLFLMWLASVLLSVFGLGVSWPIVQECKLHVLAVGFGTGGSDKDFGDPKTISLGLDHGQKTNAWLPLVWWHLLVVKVQSCCTGWGVCIGCLAGNSCVDLLCCWVVMNIPSLGFCCLWGPWS